MSFVVCIPSYKRASLCNDKTLECLHKYKVSKNLIYVFVANQQEYEIYSEILDKNKYNKIVVGKKGLVQQRQFISNFINNKKLSSNIVLFDDDVKSIDLSMSKRFKSKSLSFFFKSAFKDCYLNKSFIWGVYPVYNPFFRKNNDELSTSLKYIVGAFYGIVNRPNLNALNLTITKTNGQKEDVERTLKYFIHDGIVLRYNLIGFETKYYGKEGGLGTFKDRLKPMKEASHKLKRKYPDFGDIYTKETGMTEFKLKKIPSSRPLQMTTNLKTRKHKKKKGSKSKNGKTAKR